MQREQKHWLSLALQVKGSVIPLIWNRVLGCGLFAVLISGAYFLKLPVSQPVFGSIIPSIVLGLLLVFRTNTAYERFWEGRKLWSGLVTNIRNLARQIWVAVPENDPEARARKIYALKLMIAFAVATKMQLRGEPVNAELEGLLSSSHYLKLKTMNQPTLEIAFWIGDYIQQEYNRQSFSAPQLAGLHSLLNNMLDQLAGCERIVKTPMPLAYAIHLKQLLLLYCLLLPFQLVSALGWWTAPVVSLVSFSLFGIEEIGIEIENPFGYDANDLPLDAICAKIWRNIEDLITLTPGEKESRKESI